MIVSLVDMSRELHGEVENLRTDVSMNYGSRFKPYPSCDETGTRNRRPIWREAAAMRTAVHHVPGQKGASAPSTRIFGVASLPCALMPRSGPVRV